MPLAGQVVRLDLIWPVLAQPAQADYLLDSLLDSSSKIKENYHSLVVVTDDGRIQSGIKLRETDQTLILRTADNQILEIPLSSIEEQQDGGSSMPAGLTDKLTDVELRDLLRFLSELGKSGAVCPPHSALPPQLGNPQFRAGKYGAFGSARSRSMAVLSRRPGLDRPLRACQRGRGRG